MISLLIKYASIIFCTLYLYMKLLNITPNKKLYLSQTLLLLFTLPIVYLFRIHLASFSIFFIVILLTFFVHNFFKNSISLSVTVMSVSFGIVYFVFLIAALLVTPIGCFLDIYLDNATADIISMICIGILQLLLISLPFKLRRFKNGMTFFKNNTYNDMGVYISLSILQTASFFSIQEKPNPILIIPLFFTLLSGFSIFYWWKNNLIKQYIYNLKVLEISELQKKILEKNYQIEKLKYHNDELSKIIHKDNKLIPSMEYAVKEYLLSAKNVTCNNELLNEGTQILKQLEAVSQEREGILNNYGLKNKKLTLTNIPSVDSLLSYMFQKATKYYISFNVSFAGSIKYFVNHLITESDLRTLLADLIDNAIIASKISLSKNIMINLGLFDTNYFVEIFDSGEPFHEDILLNLGKKQVTTHANEGGSGIGLMTTFDIIKKCQASFIIEEFENNELFTKKVSIYFNNLKQIQIKTVRSNIKKSLSERDDIIVIKKK